MYVFLDESGIHLKTGHSVFALVFIETQDIPAITSAVHQIEGVIRPSTFHWKDMSWKTRKLAFGLIASLPFRFQTVVANNPILNTDVTAVKARARVLRNSDQNLQAIYYDGRKSREYEAHMKKALRDAGIKTRKFRLVEDHSYAGIQIADSIAGLYRHQLDKPSPESTSLQASITHKQI